MSAKRNGNPDLGIDYPRGAGWLSPPKALVRKRSAATASRLAERRKSIVAPVESTVRYKYTHLPLTANLWKLEPVSEWSGPRAFWRIWNKDSPVLR